MKITKEEPKEPTYSISNLTWAELSYLHLIVTEGKRYFIENRGFGSPETIATTNEFLNASSDMLWPWRK